MYRGQEPAFCRRCGTRWSSGAKSCRECNEPLHPPTADDGSGRALPAFTDQRRLVGVLTGLGVLYGLCLLGALAHGWFERGVVLDLLHGIDVPMDTLDAADLHGEVTLVMLGVYLGLIIAFGRWLVRAGRNLRARGILDTRETDETRLLWFFVPVVHVYRPLLGVMELWRGSTADDPAHWTQQPLVWWLTPWWALWLSSNALADVALYWRYDAQTPQELLRATECDLVWLALRLLCLPLFLAVVHRIDRAQRAHRPGR